MAAASMTTCEHPEESVEYFWDTAEESAEHAEWCSICGAYRVAAGCHDKPWTLPKADAPDSEIEQLRAALKKFGRHPTGDMEGVGRCKGFVRAAPFRDDLCDCGLNAALD